MHPYIPSCSKMIPEGIIICCALALISINITRILNVAVTYDEAFTYNAYLARSYHHIVSFENSLPNNHILNSILSKLSIDIFANNTFFLRLPNLLAQVFYIYTTYRICTLLFKNAYLVILAFLILNTQPLLFEFWGLCRGYGLSISLMTGSIYYMLRYFNETTTRHLLTSLLLAIAAVYSNFTLLNFYVALLAAFGVHNLFYRDTTVFKKFFSVHVLYLLCSSALLFLLVAAPIRSLESTNQLVYGGDSTFFDNTVTSLVKDGFLLRSSDPTIISISYFFTWSAYALLLYMVWLLIRRKGDIYLVTFIILLALPILSTIVQFNQFGTRFLISRTALFMMPLFALYVLAAFHKMPGRSAAILMTVICAISIGNFAAGCNITECSLWQRDKYNLVIAKLIARHTAGKVPGRKVTIAASGFFCPALQYYAHTRFKDVIESVEYLPAVVPIDERKDFYYRLQAENPAIPATYKVDTLIENEFLLISKKEF